MRGPVRVLAPAKVNLRLKVLAREEGGYHSLESLFCAVSLADELEVERSAPGVALELEGGIDAGPAEDNLVARAARGFYSALGEEPAVRIRLRKRIPSAAGLGGGSSDAAAALRALNALHGEPLAAAELMQQGIELGSDVPFFLCGSPLALGWSRGERLLPLRPLPARPVLVAHPGEAMPTGAAFRRIAERRGGAYLPRAEALPRPEELGWERLAALADNDFQPVAMESLPRLAPALEALHRAGAEIALLAGSGASVFGVFPAEARLDAAEQRLRELRFETWRARSLESLPAPVAAG